MAPFFLRIREREWLQQGVKIVADPAQCKGHVSPEIGLSSPVCGRLKMGCGVLQVSRPEGKSAGIGEGGAKKTVADLSANVIELLSPA